MMTTLFVALVMFFLGWRLGRKYQDFADLMLARRVAKLVEQREQIEKEREQFERYERQDKRLRRMMEADKEEVELV